MTSRSRALVIASEVQDELQPSGISPFTSTFFLPALLLVAVASALVAAAWAAREIGAATWMPREQQGLWWAVVVGLPVAGTALWFWTRGRTPR